MRRVIIAVIVVGVTLLHISQDAFAHVLLSDTKQDEGAVLHITPDDDPIAGEPSSLLYDIQKEATSDRTHSFSLTVHSSSNTTPLPIEIRGSSISSRYIFPSQGVYTITLTIKAINNQSPTTIFQHTQRVSRSIAPGTALSSTHSWASLVVIGSICGLLVVWIIGYNNRKAIIEYARQHSP